MKKLAIVGSRDFEDYDVLKTFMVSNLNLDNYDTIVSGGAKGADKLAEKFADEYKMGTQDAYFYLKKYGGLEFLMTHWWALHTDNPFWAVRHLYDVCYENGGER